MSSVVRLAAQPISEALVLQKSEYFSDVQVWPERSVLDPNGWLGNFQESERSMAATLLNSFLFVNERMTNGLLRAGVQALSTDIVAAGASLAEAKALWRSFRGSLVLSYVHGETPRAVDSGLLFARKARQVLEINENQIVDPLQAVLQLRDRSEGTLLLLDDFVGSGRQMEATWIRVYGQESGSGRSIAGLCSNGINVIYVPLIATSYGVNTLITRCHGLQVRPVHLLDHRYSAIACDSVLWPDEETCIR